MRKTAAEELVPVFVAVAMAATMASSVTSSPFIIISSAHFHNVEDPVILIDN